MLELTPYRIQALALTFICQSTHISPGFAASDPGTGATSGLEEIVVTATKRQEDVSKVPISITAFGPKDLEAAGVKGIDQLALVTPGIEFDQNSAYGGGNLTNIAIRGINSIYGASTTGIYFDDTVLAANVDEDSVFGNPYPTTFDLERVEVLRGPQGTLFGAGSEGGTLRFIPKSPSLTDYSGEIDLELAGTKGGSASYEGGLAVGGPIIPGTLGFRFSAWYRRDGGYVDRVSPFGNNATVENNSNSQETNAYRLALLWHPVDGLKVTPSIYVKGNHKDDTSAFSDYLSDPAADIFKNGSIIAQPSTDSLDIAALKVEADLGQTTLTSISSYTYRSAISTIDLTSAFPIFYVGFGYDGNPLPAPLTLAASLPLSPSDAAPNVGTLKQHSYSQELRLASALPDSRFKWVAGLFGSYSQQVETNNQYSVYGASVYSAALGTPVAAGANLQASDPTSSETQVAAFGQIDFQLTDRLAASAGLRVASTQTKQTTYSAGAIYEYFGGIDPLVSIGKTEHPVTPKATLSYQLDPKNLVYVSIGKGYRAGGANVTFPSYCPSVKAAFDSDSLWSYEVGAKNRLFDDHLEIDSSLYHIDWRNIQTALPLACGYIYLLNGGEAKTNGFDVAVHGKFFEHWLSTFSVAYVDSKYSKTINAPDANGNPTVPFIQSGDAVGVAPQVAAPWSLTAALQYNYNLFGQKNGYARAEDVFHSHNAGPYVTTVSSAILRADPSTNLLNFRFGGNWGHYDASLFLNNALNSSPRIGKFNLGSGIAYTYSTTFRPITFGVSLDYKF